MREYEFVQCETYDSGKIVRIMLNRPEARNAQNRGMLVELNDAFLEAEADDEVRVVILGGTGPMFSSGHDLGSKVYAKETEPGPEQHPTRKINGATRKGAENMMLQEWHYYFENTRRWRNLRKITIGQAHGDVYAAGLMLLWACDLILCAQDTRFADVVGTRLGMCGVEYFAHPWELGPRKAKELLLTGDSLDADEAYALGMVTKVFPAEDLSERTLEFAVARSAAADHVGLADQRSGEPDHGQHGFLQRSQRLLHSPRAQSLSLGASQRGWSAGGERGCRCPEIGARHHRSSPRSRTRSAPIGRARGASADLVADFESGPVPVPEIGCSLVGALEEFQESGIGILSGPHGGVREDEFPRTRCRSTHSTASQASRRSPLVRDMRMRRTTLPRIPPGQNPQLLSSWL